MMGLGPNQSSQAPLPEQSAVKPVQHPPVWAQRLMVGTEAGIAVWAGILVLLVPWTRLWTENHLLAAWPTLHFLINVTFVRGMISGVGLVDIWMGVVDVLRLRDIR